LNPVAQKITSEIRANGAISFARFMDLALYCPVYGYYEKEADTVGRRGDYYTSVSVGNLFGELLACQFADWLEECPKSGGRCPEPVPREAEAAGTASEVQLVEAGAHCGDLARDILAWLRRRRPALFQRLSYWILEPSERRQGWQQRTLAEFAPRVRWAKGFDHLAMPAGRPATSGVTPSAEARVRGVIFANELLDAFPVHRLGWDAQRGAWFEWGVTLEGERLVWTRLENPVRVSGPAACPSEWLPDQHAVAGGLPGTDPELPSLAEVLPEGFTIEVCPAAMEWWRSAARVLRCGRLLTFDYGLSAGELLAPERRHGTLRSYRDHQPADDPLASPGLQDLTAHVDFTSLQAAGEAAGLTTETRLAQAQFLTGIAARIWREPSQFGQWGQKQTRQFLTLTHPEHLGRAFRVLVQNKF